MSGFSYHLAVLTHGHNAPLVAETMRAFEEFVSPPPSSRALFVDGPPPMVKESLYPPFTFDEVGYLVSREPQGFCASTAAMWAFSCQGDHDYVYWLEHDFVHIRPVDLRDLAAVLDYAGPGVAQMALMRDAYSAEEKAAGGLFEYRRADFVPMAPWGADDTAGKPDAWGRWLRMPWFTTNPSLMRRDFMAAHPFIAGEPHCEGKFGVALAQEGWSFGTWGSGEVWCRHVGQRDGSGYGY